MTIHTLYDPAVFMAIEEYESSTGMKCAKSIQDIIVVVGDIQFGKRYDIDQYSLDIVGIDTDIDILLLTTPIL